MNGVIPKQMRAVVYHGRDDLRVEVLPVPRIGSHELLVKVATCGVCPTDIKKIKFGTVPPPRVFGHETAGTIVKIGALVRGWRVGDRVALHHHVPCLNCHYCRHRAFAQCPTYKKTGITAGFEPAGGGYAEFVRVMRIALPGVVKIPPRNTFEEGAMLEPVNTVLKAIKRLALQRSDQVWVIGQGPIGLIFTRLLNLSGIRVTASDLIASRLALAERFGAARVINGSQGDKLSSLGEVIDAVVVAAASNSAVEAALNAVRGAGRVLLFSHTQRNSFLNIDLATICVDEKDIVGSYSSDFTLQKEVAKLVFSRRIDVRTLATHRYPLNNTKEAIDLAADRPENSLKIFVSAVDKSE